MVVEIWLTRRDTWGQVLARCYFSICSPAASMQQHDCRQRAAKPGLGHSMKQYVFILFKIILIIIVTILNHLD